MAEIVSLSEAIAGLVHDGDSVALEGFTHLIPFAAGSELLRQGRRELGSVPRAGSSSLTPATPASARCIGFVMRSSTAGRVRSRSRSTAMPGWRTATRRAPQIFPSP
jgi:acyl CoA:acetate/3-ketoacid CoA transferase alpha subunit